MLNKELLLATEGQTAGHIKLTVGKYSSDPVSYGYINSGDLQAGSVSKVPVYNLNGNPMPLTLLSSDNYQTSMWFGFADAIDHNSIRMTIVEKGLTVEFNKTVDWVVAYVSHHLVFNSSDVGKTFTIVFDPEPTGYV